MPSVATPLARLAASLILLLALPAWLGGCGSRSRELQPGSYRAVLTTPGGELPFGLDVAAEEGRFVLQLINGDERVRVSEVTVKDGTLHAIMPGYENSLSARVSGGRLEGQVSLLRADGERQALPFGAEIGQTWRFFEEPVTDNADVSGRWSVTFTDVAGTTSPGVAELTQLFGTVTGTILTPTGDHLRKKNLRGRSGLIPPANQSLHLHRQPPIEAHQPRRRDPRGKTVHQPHHPGCDAPLPLMMVAETGATSARITALTRLSIGMCHPLTPGRAHQIIVVEGHHHPTSRGAGQGG